MGTRVCTTCLRFLNNSEATGCETCDNLVANPTPWPLDDHPMLHQHQRRCYSSLTVETNHTVSPLHCHTDLRNGAHLHPDSILHLHLNGQLVGTSPTKVPFPVGVWAQSNTYMYFLRPTLVHSKAVYRSSAFADLTAMTTADKQTTPVCLYQ